MEFLLADHNLPYTVALTLGALFTLLEVLGSAFGLAPSSALDELLPFDFDGTLPGAWLGWAGAGQVPTLVWFMTWLGSFGLVGTGLTLGAATFMEVPLPLIFSLIPTVLLAFPVTAIASRSVARIVPSEERSAVEAKSFEGVSAEIRSGVALREVGRVEADKGLPDLLNGRGPLGTRSKEARD